MAFAKGATMFDKIVSFLKRIVTYVLKVVSFITRHFFPECTLFDWIDKDEAADWMNATSVFIDDTIFSRLENDADAIALLFQLIKEGEEKQQLISKAYKRSTIMPMIQNRLRGLYNVRKELAKKINIPIAKFAPFSVYIAGESQIGKSWLLKDLAQDLEDIIPYSSKEFHPEMAPFVVPLGKYWDHYSGQEIIVFDDFNRVTPSEIEHSEPTYLLNLVGPAIAVVPKADIESKGTVSNAKLILCASNYLYPTINGINAEVLQNRRHSTWKAQVIKQYPACSVHEAQQNGEKVFEDDEDEDESAGPSRGRSRPHMQNPKVKQTLRKGAIFTCADCMAMPGTLDSVRKFEHLSFTQYNNYSGNGTKPMTAPLGYAGFIQIVRAQAEKHYSAAIINYKAELTRKGEDPENIKEYLVPKRPFHDFNRQVDEAKRKDILASLGGTIEGCIRPAMLNWLVRKWFKPADIYNESEIVKMDDDEDYLEGDEAVDAAIEHGCLHFAGLDQIKDLTKNNDRETVKKVCNRLQFHRGYHDVVYISSAGVGYVLPSKSKCSAECSYLSATNLQLRTAFISEIVSYLVTNGMTPHFVPARFVPQSHEKKIAAYKRQLLEKDIVSRVRSIRDTLLTISAIAIPTLIWVGANIWLISKIDEAETSYINKHATALFPSGIYGAVKNESGGGSAGPIKKVVARRHISLSRNKIRPSMDTLENNLRRFKRNVVEIRFLGELVASAISFSPKLYYTQSHSIHRLLTLFSLKAQEYLKANNVSDDNRQKLMSNIAKDLKVSFESVSKQETSIIVEISMAQLLKMNNNLFVFTGDSDGCLLVVDNENIKTSGLWDDVQSERNSISESNMSVMRYRRDKWFDMKDAVNTLIIENDEVEYLEEHCPWAKDYGMVDEGYVKFVVQGYRCKNIYGQDAKTMCGSIIIDKTTGKILGVMSASSDKYLWFNAITQESLRHYGACHNIGKLIVETTPTNADLVAFPSNVEVFATSPPSRIFHSTKDEFLPSSIAGEMSQTHRKPANIEVDHDRGVKSFERGVKHYSPHKDFDFDLQDIFDDVEQGFVAMETDLEFCDVRTVREAICGIPGKVKSIDMNTSPGFPFVEDPALKVKRNLFQFDDEGLVTGINKTLQEMMVLEMDMMKKGQDVATIYQISHKGELLEDPDKVRLIQGSPISLSLHTRQYFMDFNYAFQFDRMNLEHAVGINPYGLDWDTLTRRLLNTGRHILVGDYSKFGPRLYNKFVDMAYEIMISWYTEQGATEESNLVRRELKKRVINSLNIAYDRIFQVKCGSPSGAINTVIVNSICNMLYFRTAYKGIMSEKRPELATMHAFREKICLFVYGDDVIASVAEDIIDVFNNRSISDFFAQYDIKYTDIIKDGEIRPYCSIVDATFLKEGFKLFTETGVPGGIWICQPSKKGLIDITNWIRKPRGNLKKEARSLEEKLATVVNCETSLRLMWFYGREEFNEYRTKLRKAIKDKIGNEHKMTFYTFDGLQVELGYPPVQQMKDPGVLTSLTTRGAYEFLLGSD